MDKNFCLMTGVGIFKRGSLRTSLSNLIDKMRTIDPTGQYSYEEKKGLFKSEFKIIGKECDPKCAKFFIAVVTPRLTEGYNG